PRGPTSREVPGRARVPWRPTAPRGRVREDSRQRRASRALGEETAAAVAAGIDLDHREAQGGEAFLDCRQPLGNPGNPARFDLDARAPPVAMVADPQIARHAELPGRAGATAPSCRRSNGSSDSRDSRDPRARACRARPAGHRSAAPPPAPSPTGRPGRRRCDPPPRPSARVPPPAAARRPGGPNRPRPSKRPEPMDRFARARASGRLDWGGPTWPNSSGSDCLHQRTFPGSDFESNKRIDRRPETYYPYDTFKNYHKRLLLVGYQRTKAPK